MIEYEMFQGLKIPKECDFKNKAGLNDMPGCRASSNAGFPRVSVKCSNLVCYDCIAFLDNHDMFKKYLNFIKD